MFIFEKVPFKECHASTLVEQEVGKLMAAWFAVLFLLVLFPQIVLWPLKLFY